MAITEFCARSGGSNLNAGTLDGSAEPSTSPLVTYTGGSWNATTDVFTVASGNPVTDGVAVGHWVSIYTSGASVTNFIAQVTARTSTTITVSTSARAGSEPTTGTYDLRVGGAWQGPNGASGFPVNPMGINTAVGAGTTGNRLNLKADQTYSITANVNGGTGAFPSVVQGYTSAFGDGGRAAIDGGTGGASYVLLSGGGTAQACAFRDVEFRNNGATGSSAGVTWSGSAVAFERCVFRDLRGSGFSSTSTTRAVFAECEAYGCNQSNTANGGGFVATGGFGVFVRCVAHDNAGSNTRGFRFNGLAVGCVADSNGSHGFDVVTAGSVSGCVAHGNGGDGVADSFGAVENCVLTANGAWGVNGTATTLVATCAFGSGTQANTSGTVNGANLVSGSITLGSNLSPFTDAANGDFRLNSTANAGALLRGTGRGAYTQTATSYGGTVGYPDIGAAQHQETGGSGGVTLACGW